MSKVVQWVLAAAGMVITVTGALAVWEVQVRQPGGSLWLVTVFVLFNWVILGFIIVLGIFLGSPPGSVLWLRAAWFAVGGLVPLVVLGAFSIGGVVLLSLLAFLVGALLATFQRGARLYLCVGHFLLGMVANLGLLFLVIFIS